MARVFAKVVCLRLHALTNSGGQVCAVVGVTARSQPAGQPAQHLPSHPLLRPSQPGVLPPHLEEDAGVDSAQAQQLQDLLGLGGHIVDTADADLRYSGTARAAAAAAGISGMAWGGAARQQPRRRAEERRSRCEPLRSAATRSSRLSMRRLLPVPAARRHQPRIVAVAVACCSCRRRLPATFRPALPLLCVSRLLPGPQHALYCRMPARPIRRLPSSCPHAVVSINMPRGTPRAQPPAARVPHASSARSTRSNGCTQDGEAAAHSMRSTYAPPPRRRRRRRLTTNTSLASGST